ncbi:Crp/Fnr family transcriptional regulator [Bacteroidota bacterium]
MLNKLQITACTISLHDCRCFEKLTNDERKLVEDNSVIIKYKKKEIICKQGGFVSHVMYVKKGLVKVYLDSGQNSLVLKIIPECNLVGLSSVSEEYTTYNYSVMAYIDTEIQQIDLNVFRQLLSQNASFSKEVINIFSISSAQVYGRFFCLTHKQAYGRLADILLCLSDRIFKKSEFHLPLSRQDLADLSGMSSETVIRILKKFNDEGLIRMDGKSLEIINYEKLQQISETG